MSRRTDRERGALIALNACEAYLTDLPLFPWEETPLDEVMRSAHLAAWAELQDADALRAARRACA